ncbi:hypothetical protein [Amycolatopsis sp. cmx-11-51]|uniref:hypothetical protein n=1 Tax=Amycolatopsis sp. cmx-11-51 TaxID=2785797 RepID=UPI0039E46612
MAGDAAILACDRKNVAFLLIVYFGLLACGVALVGATSVSLLGSIVTFQRTNKIHLVRFGMGITVAVVTGGPRLELAKDLAITGVMAISLSWLRPIFAQIRRTFRATLTCEIEERYRWLRTGPLWVSARSTSLSGTPRQDHGTNPQLGGTRDRQPSPARTSRRNEDKAGHRGIGAPALSVRAQPRVTSRHSCADALHPCFMGDAIRGGAPAFDGHAYHRVTCISE